MNKGLLFLNVLLLIAVAVLYFLFFNAKKPAAVKSGTVKVRTDSTGAATPFQIAYFEMDSVEQNFSLAKEMQQELNRLQDAKASRMNTLQKQYQDQIRKFQEQENMTPQQYEAAQKQLANLQNQMQNAGQKADQDANDYFMKKQQEILSLIRGFFEDYNKDQHFSYIIASEPGLIFLKDSAYNITPELLRGLDSIQESKKKK